MAPERDFLFPPAMTSAPITAFALAAADGVKITAFRAVPAVRPRGVVQIAHGMAEHINRYRRLIHALTDAGYAVFAADHRGHGASAAAHGIGSFGPGGFASLVSDMAALSKLARAEFPGVPLILLGHSMGSFAAQVYLLEHHELIAGLVLSGTAAVDLMMAAMATSGAEPGLKAMNAPFRPARTDFDWLSRDAAEVDLYIDDPLCGFDLDEAARTSIFVTAGPARLDARLNSVRAGLPVRLISGQMDPVTGPDNAFAQALLETYRTAGLTDISHRIYPGGRHEMFNETNRAEVTADLIGWLNDTLAGGG